MFERFRRRNDDGATRAAATDDRTSVLSDGDARYEDRAAADHDIAPRRMGRFDRGTAAGATTIDAERERELADDRGTRTRLHDRDGDGVDDRDEGHRGAVTATAATAGVTGVEAARVVRARQREHFGGFNFGASFFGWLVAVGIAAILAGIISAAGAALGLTEVSSTDAQQNAETIGLVGGIVLLVALMIAYSCGGYVAGRLSRFDGARQGLGAWAIGIVMAIALAVLAVIAGSEYNVLNQLNLPNIPIDRGTLTTGGAIALAAFVLGTLLAAVVGGKAGERYHRRVDRVGFEV
jgi:hypothetical protein